MIKNYLLILISLYTENNLYLTGNYAEYSYPDKGPNLGLFELGVGWQIRLFIYNQN